MCTNIQGKVKWGERIEEEEVSICTYEQVRVIIE